MRLDGQAASIIRHAFPSALAEDVDHVLAAIVPGSLAPKDHAIGRVTIDGESVRIPSRVYFPDFRAALRTSLSPMQEQILACIYTRHHDGYVRELAVKQIITSTAAWVPPFVVQLIGEYVVEIVQLIREHVENLKQPAYQRFVAVNPGFIALTRQRATSYWNCYYRSRWSRKDEYPALELLRVLDWPTGNT